MKRIGIIIAVIALVLVVFFTVKHFMGQKAGYEEQEQIQGQEDKTDVTYEGTNLELQGVEGNICLFKQKNGKLYLLTGQESGKAEEGEAYTFYQIDRMNRVDNGAQPISIKNEKVVAFCVDQNGNIIYMAEEEREGSRILDLVKIDEIGNELDRENLDKTIKDDGIYLSGLTADQNGQIVLACREGIYFFNEQLQVSGKITPETGQVIDIALAKTGDIVCVVDQLNSSEISSKVYLLNSEKKQWGDLLSIDLNMDEQEDYILEGEDFDFCYKGDSGIYGYNIETGKSAELINYDASYMTGADAERIICAGKCVFIGKTEAFTDGKKKITLVEYTKKDTSKKSEKNVITFGTFHADPNIKNAAAKFNRSSSEYEIVIQEYYDMDEERLLADIAAGNAQDIIDINTFPLSVRQCISQGLIEDLTPYFEKDPLFTVDDMLAPVKNATEHDGKLYYVTPGFSLTTMAAMADTAGNADGWTVSEFKKVMEKQGDDTDLFSVKYTKETCLDIFLYYNLSDYINWEEGTIDFDNEDFKYILELCNKKGLDGEGAAYDEVEIAEAVDSQYARLKAGQYILLDEQDFNIQSVQLLRKAVGEDIVYIGGPNKKKEGSCFVFSNKIAISSQSKVKEQAWEFIRTFMLEDYQNTLSDYDAYMPVSQKVFDSRIKELMATEAYMNEYGEYVEPVEERTIQYGDSQIKMSVPSKEEVDMYLNLIDKTKHSVDVDPTVLNIIMEEAKGYFNGRKKLDKTVEVIEKRVAAYVNEQK